MTHWPCAFTARSQLRLKASLGAGGDNLPPGLIISLQPPSHLIQLHLITRYISATFGTSEQVIIPPTHVPNTAINLWLSVAGLTGSLGLWGLPSTVWFSGPTGLNYMHQSITIILLKSVCDSLQTAILARSSQEMYQTVRIEWKHFLSRVHVSVRPSIFLHAKNAKELVETVSPARVFIWMNQRPPTIYRQRPVEKGR